MGQSSLLSSAILYIDQRVRARGIQDDACAHSVVGSIATFFDSNSQKMERAQVKMYNGFARE
jgi:hypothetical protein